MPLDKSKIRKILVVSLSNIGDVILTFPVIDILKRDFPSAQLSVVIGPKAQTLFNSNPSIHKIHIYNKKQPIIQTLSWVGELINERFDLVVDLRNTAIPFFIFPRYRTTFIDCKDSLIHKKYEHLGRLRSIWRFGSESRDLQALFIPKEDQEIVDKRLTASLRGDKKFVVIAPGAASPSKRWSIDGFALLCQHISKQYALPVVFVGDDNDRAIADQINARSAVKAENFCGQTTLTQLAHILKRSLLVIANDSSVMHLASYLNLPVLAIFGPTDPLRYGPWSSHSKFLKSPQKCDACESPKEILRHTCMQGLSAEAVIKSFQIRSQEVIFN